MTVPVWHQHILELDWDAHSQACLLCGEHFALERADVAERLRTERCPRGPVPTHPELPTEAPTEEK